MRIDQLNVKNFKCFKDQTLVFHPQFNLIVGVNGVGKTSILDALSVAVGSWFLGVIAFDTRHIKQSEVRLAGYSQKIVNRPQDFVFYAQPQYPVIVHAMGEVQGQHIEWQRSLNTPKGRTTYTDARSIKEIATEVDHLVSDGKDISLPLLSYYGTGRLWDIPRDQAQVRPTDITYKAKNSLSRFRGYKNSVDPRLSPSDLVYWIAEQSWITYQQGGDAPILIQVVKNAILGCIEGSKNIFFDPRFGEVIIEFDNQSTQPFNNLSDGQRCMFAMIGDIAQKAAVLNPHLGDKVLEETTGIVLIDELDLHLHPKWQRRIIDDLKTTFPKVQFICTTHSPQLIGQAKADEVILLGSPFPHPPQSYGMDSNWILRNVMDSDERDTAVKQQLDKIFEHIEDNEFDIAEDEVNALRQQIGEHPELVEAAALISRYSRFEPDSAEDE